MSSSVARPGVGRGFVQWLVSTQPGWGGAVLRLGLAGVMWPHGAQKLLGWFGGYGYEGTMGFLTGCGIPAPIAFLVIVGEFFAPLLLVAGFLTRFAAASVAAIMLGAMLLVHLPNGFFAAENGVELHLAILTVALALVFQGAGSASIDRKLTQGA